MAAVMCTFTFIFCSVADFDSNNPLVDCEVPVTRMLI